MDQLITSPSNPRIKAACALRERRERDSTGLFLIEGYRELLRASEGGVRIETLFVAPELFLGSNEEALITQLACPTITCSNQAFHKLSYRDRPDGLLAVAYKMNRPLQTLEGTLFVVAQGIEKPGNLGTILRSCDGAGVHGVLVCDHCTDIYNPNTVRASVGTLFTLPVVEVTSEEAISWLRAHNIAILAATPEASTIYSNANLTQPLAIAVGSEQLGLSPIWKQRADLTVRIPMQGHADSLNVAQATTILLFEAQRQRGNK